MSLLKYVDRLNRMHDLIKRQCTGTSEEFAEKLGLSRSVLMDNIREMKELGASIGYNSLKRSYFYEQDFSIIIGSENRRRIRGGKGIFLPVSGATRHLSDIFDLNSNSFYMTKQFESINLSKFQEFKIEETGKIIGGVKWGINTNSDSECNDEDCMDDATDATSSWDIIKGECPNAIY